MKKLLLALALLFAPIPAMAQCTGVFGANTVCGSVGGGIPHAVSASVFPTNSPGGSSGQVQFNNAGSFGGLTNVQLTALIQTFSPTLSGTVPASGGGTTNFLRADGSWTTPPYPVTSVFGRTGPITATAGDYNASQITYTPPGTGAVATTVAVELARIIWANDFGAACNGGGNDATAFQNAINFGQNTTVPVKFEGNCAITAALSITGYIDFGGAHFVSQLTQTNTAVDIIDINTGSNAPDYIHDMYLIYSAAAANTTQAINVTSPSSENTQSRFERLNIGANASTDINFVRASGWFITSNVLLSTHQCIVVANQNVGDSGDSTIYSNTIQSSTGGSGIIWNSSGGLRIINNKFNGTNMNFGIQVALANGVTTADMFITGNSIEGLSTSSGDGIFFGRAGTTGGLGTVIINGNETTGNEGVVSPTDANGVWLNNLVIVGNICVTCNLAGIGIDSVQGIVISDNFIQPNVAGTVPIAMGTHGPTATNCVVGPNPHLGTAAASALGSCTGISPN